MKSPPPEGTRRFRITVDGDSINLQGFLDVETGSARHTTFTEFERMVEAFGGTVTATPVVHSADDASKDPRYDPLWYWKHQAPE